MTNADAQYPKHPACLPLGQDGVLIRFAMQPAPEAANAAQAFCAALGAADLPGVCEIAPALASVYLRFDPARITRANIVTRIEALLLQTDWLHAPAPPAKRIWHVPVVLGGAAGPQLAEAAAAAGISETQARAELTEGPLRTLAIGFAPGQPYLGLLPEHWNIPRLDSLTGEVPAGAVVVAVRQIVLFANPSPTGWRQVGRTGFRLFRPAAEAPFALQPGDAIRFHAAPESELESLLAQDGGGARCEVQS